MTRRLMILMSPMLLSFFKSKKIIIKMNEETALGLHRALKLGVPMTGPYVAPLIRQLAKHLKDSRDLND